MEGEQGVAFGRSEAGGWRWGIWGGGLETGPACGVIEGAGIGFGGERAPAPTALGDGDREGEIVFGGRRGEGGGDDLDAIASVVFGETKGVVGGLEQSAQIGGMFGEACDTDGEGEMEGVFFCFVGREAQGGDVLSQAICKTQGSRGIGFFEQDSEFFSAVSGSGIGFANDLCDGIAKLKEDFIADEMAVGIVDLFEVIEVEHQDRKGALVTAGSLEGGVGAFHEGTVIVESGQSVSDGEVFDACDVSEVGEEGSDLVGEHTEALFDLGRGKGVEMLGAECDHADGFVAQQQREQVERFDAGEAGGFFGGEIRAFRAQVTGFWQGAAVFERERKEGAFEREDGIAKEGDIFCGGEGDMGGLRLVEVRDKSPLEGGNLRGGIEDLGGEGVFVGGLVESLADVMEEMEMLEIAVSTAEGAISLEGACEEEGDGFECGFFAGRKGLCVDAINADRASDLLFLSDGDGEDGADDGVSRIIVRKQ